MAQSLTLLTLPSDMLYGILCYVPKEFLPTVFRICQKLGAVSKSEDFWHRYATTSFPPIELPAPHAPIYWKPEGESWKWYIRIHKDLGTRANHTGLGSKKKPYYLHALYRGEWKEGIRTGWGIAFMETKDVYIGYFDTNRRHGKGKFYCSNGDVFEGDHLEDAHTGFGIYRWANGNNYEGNFQKFKREGQGTFTEGKGGWKITGNWKDGFPADESGNNSLDYVLTRINPKVADAIKSNVCTFTATGEDRYAQPFYELKAPEDGRPHGICVSCYNACKDKNSYKFTEPNSIFGGNFFCDCGAEIDKALKCHALGK